MKIRSTLMAAATLAACTWAQAQSAAPSSVTLYGSIDQYIQYMRSSSGVSLTSLNDGAMLRSRVGLRGSEDLGSGLNLKFTLEHGLFADSGAQADSTGRFFDRQAWVGLATPHGEWRVGRQNTVIFTRSEFIDYSGRTLASTANHYGQPARLDNDLTYISPRIGGVLVELHLAPGEQPDSTASKRVWQLGIDYLNGPWRVGYAGLRAQPPSGAAVDKTIAFDNYYLNHDWGQGKLYFTFIRSNNSTVATKGVFGNNAGAILGATGALVAGTDANAKRYHHVWQVSADWRVRPNLRVGGLIGRIDDRSNGGQDAKGASVGAFYDLSRRTTLYTSYEVLDNERNAGFVLSGSAPVLPNFSAADVNGQRIQGLQFGIVHRF